jgi:NAD+ diphosphatase
MPPAARRHNIFAGPYVDRRSELRKDAAAVAAALADPTTRLVPVWRTRNLLRRVPAPSAVLLEITHEISTTLSRGELIMLGTFRGTHTFAIEFEGDEPPALAHESEFVDLRMAGGWLPQDEAGLLAYARAMVFWRARHRYCGACGSPTVATQAGHVMQCSNAQCGNEVFPRIDPAIIVLVSDGERALLGRQASWPAGRYSTIAGFVEPGESLEDCVAREVREETGVEVASVSYHSSQPWPFPSSLMLGFQATAPNSAIVRADQELEDARWFTREDIATGRIGLPPSQSISYRLIEDWYDRDATRPLSAEPAVNPWDTSR